MSSQPPPIPSQPNKILVVDDDAVVVKALSMKLASQGYKVFTASEPSAAVQSVRRDNPDLILLDVNFPPEVEGVLSDGFRIAEWIRRMSADRNIPVIIITGNDSEKFKQRAEEIGAVGFFHKPVQSDDLLSVIKETLSKWPAVKQ